MRSSLPHRGRWLGRICHGPEGTTRRRVCGRKKTSRNSQVSAGGQSGYFRSTVFLLGHVVCPVKPDGKWPPPRVCVMGWAPEAAAGPRSRPQGSGLGLPSRIAPDQHPRVHEGREASGPQTVASSSERPRRPGAGLCSLRLHARTKDKGRLASRASVVEQRGPTTPVVSVHEGRAQPVASCGGLACEMVAVRG